MQTFVDKKTKLKVDSCNVQEASEGGHGGQSRLDRTYSSEDQGGLPNAILIAVERSGCLLSQPVSLT